METCEFVDNKREVTSFSLVVTTTFGYLGPVRGRIESGVWTEVESVWVVGGGGVGRVCPYDGPTEVGTRKSSKSSLRKSEVSHNGSTEAGGEDGEGGRVRPS